MVKDVERYYTNTDGTVNAEKKQIIDEILQIDNFEKAQEIAISLVNEIYRLKNYIYDLNLKVEENKNYLYDVNLKVEENKNYLYDVNLKVEENKNYLYDLNLKSEENKNYLYDVNLKVEENKNYLYDVNKKNEELSNHTYDLNERVEAALTALKEFKEEIVESNRDLFAKVVKLQSEIEKSNK